MHLPTFTWMDMWLGKRSLLIIVALPKGEDIVDAVAGEPGPKSDI